MKTMYPAQVNSPGTELADAIDAAQDTILVADGSVLPDGPNLLTIGTDEAAETILYTGKTGDELTGVTRGFQGTAQSWAAGTKVARYFTAYDHDAAIDNVRELSTGLTATRDRLDIEERQDVVLNAGMQILNAQRRAAFSLSGIKGRTLVNMAGKNSHVSVNDPSVVVLNVGYNSVYKNTDIINVDIKNTNEAYIVYRQVDSSSFSFTAGKYYVILADIKINSISGNGEIKLGGTANGAFTADKTKIGVWQKVCHRFTATSDSSLGIIAGTCYAGGVFATANFDIRNVSFYEISQSDYDNLRNLSEKELAEKYPYVDSVQPVRNPYAIRYGENLLPPFYEWTPIGITEGSLTEPYAANFKVSSSQSTFYYIDMKLPANTKYTFSAEHNGYLSVTDLIRESTILDNTSAQSATFTNINETTVRIYVSNVYGAPINGAYFFKKPILTLGTEAKPFKPREDTMLALQTDLYSDPLTSANADEVFEKDGQYFKLAKWKNVVLDGAHPWAYISSATGYKCVRIPGLPNSQYFSSPTASHLAQAVKYDGKILEMGTIGMGADKFQNSSNGYFYMNLANADTGWGDNYTPTADEIKAYFMGWIMYDGSLNGGAASPNNPAGNVYNGTGSKAWCYRRDGVSSSYDGPTATLPTTLAPNWTPYQLVYQLTTPTIEPIVSEGMLTFNEGDNQIEVGTGIVIRENAVPSKDSNNVWNIGNPVANQASKGFKYKAKSVIAVYKNSLRDYQWLQYVTEKYGALVQEKQPNAIYDPSAAYSATYLMLDKSPIVPFSGSYAANEKAMLQELTDAVQQNATAVSVLMNKKADKDGPGWITPTLLNGWVNFSTDYYGAGYVKTSDGLVFFRGIIRNGPVGQNIFILPPGFRPSKTLILDAISHNNSTYIASAVRVYPDGRVFLDVGSFYHLSLESINPFLAEQ